MKKAVVIGPYRRHNFGDDLVGAIIATHLKRRGYEASVPLLGKVNTDWLGIEHAPGYGNRIAQADTVVLGGGGILSDTSGPNPGMSYAGIIARAALNGTLAGKKTYVTSVGAGPWLLEASKMYTVLVTLAAEKVGVRDSESRRHLSELGVDGRNIVEGADLALLSSDYLEFDRVASGKIGMQFDLGVFKDILGNPNVDAIRRAVKTYAAKHKDSVALVSNSERDSQILSTAAAGVELMNYSALQDFMPRLAGLKAIFTSHLHLAIVAYSQRIPCFSLYVREKTKRFYGQIGHPERAIDLSTATVADFERLIAAAETAEWTDEDEARLQELQTQARTLLEFVK